MNTRIEQSCIGARTVSNAAARTALAMLAMAVFAAAAPGCDNDPPPPAAAHDHDEHEAHDDHVGHDHADHDHAESDAHDEHAGHDHGAHDEHTDEVVLTAEAVQRYGITIAEAQKQTLAPTFTVPARVDFNAEAMAHVGSPLRGRAVEIPVRLGDRVKKNDPLVIVESPELGQAQADFLQKRAAARSAAPHADLAKTAWERAKGLYDQSKGEGISLADVQKREAEHRLAAADVQAAEAAAMAAEHGLRLFGMDPESIQRLATTGEIMPRHTIRAAIDGQVVQREITLGELVSPERDVLMVLADTGSLWVLANVPEARLGAVAVGAKAWVTVGTAAEGAGRIEGKVAFISPMVDVATRTAQVRIEVAASGTQAMRPGMFAQVEIVATAPGGAEPAPQVAVPQEAVQTVEGGPAVFVPVEDEANTFQKRAITIGPAVGGFVPVLSGLAAGEKFVATGSFILKAELGKGSAEHEH